MSVKKVKEVDSIYSGGSNKRSRILDDISCSSNATGARWTSILSCCWKRNRERKSIFKEYNPNEWDYIVEKLVVKRVPLSFYATEEDFQEIIEEKNYKELSYGPVMGPATKEMRDKQVYSAMTDMRSSLFFLKTKARGDLSNKASNKNLRFNRDQDMLDEDAMQAGPSNYNRNMSDLRMREEETRNAFLNRFSALHPDLKDHEIPPKDPNPLNPPQSKRSLAENMSEIASARKSPGVKSKQVNDRNNKGSKVYTTVSDTSREISTVLGEEIPTRDKSVSKNTSSICRKIGGTSCLPYPQKVLKTYRNASNERKQICREVNSPRNQQKLSETTRDQDSKIKSVNKASQFKVHHISSEQHSMNKLVKLNPNELDTSLVRRRKNDSELSETVENKTVSDATSYTSNDYKNVNSAGTTLRWKIIIKHHQPTESQTASESATDFPENSTLPIMPNDNFSRSKSLSTNSKSYDKVGTEDKKGYDKE